MLVVDQLAVIAERSQRFADILRTGPLDVEVPSTPGWSLEELGWHMVGVQQWATSVVETGVAPSHEINPPQGTPADALVASHHALIAALETADPEAECWNFTSTEPQVTSFWVRRQANEVAVHCWDAESAVSDRPPAFEADLAVQIIDEFVHVMMPRVIGRESLDLSGVASDVHLHCTDAAGEWTFEIIDGQLVVVDEHRKSAVALRGPASELALFLYNRGGEAGIEVFGESDELDKWRPAFRF